MEEEVGKKVTRLRRRLSVDAEESPSAPSTPTKKRGGRLAAKPQLELIDENSTDISPKKTKKSAAKTKAEPDEEKPATPARRSTRIRSNTSLLSDTSTLDVPEDKGTPSRRSARIKSNTSIVSENTQGYESPRAKRASRRTSQVGSDNDTPARTVRTTRKKSTSYIDKTELNTSTTSLHINKAIIEEAEKKVSTSNISPKAESPLRKSPRLNQSSGLIENKENHPTSENSVKQSQDDAQTELITKENQSSGNTSHNNLSVSSSNLIKLLASEPPKKSSIANKSFSDLEENQNKGKRHRTKSWTTISASPSNDASFCSDSEFVSKKGKNKITSFIHHMSGSGDGHLNLSNYSVKNKSRNKELMQNTSTVEKSNQSNIMGDSTNSQISENYFEKAPSSITKPLVYIEDSDSNSAMAEKVKEKDSEDQCVPVVQHNLVDEKTKQASNLSYEPMDIDETMTSFTDKNDSVRLESKELNRSTNKSSRKSLITELVCNENTNEETKLISKRKSSLIINETPTASVSPPSFPNDNTDKSYNSLRNSVPLNLDEVDASVQTKRKSSISDNINNEEYKEINKCHRNAEIQDANSSTMSQCSMKISNKLNSSLDNNQEIVDTPNSKMQSHENEPKDSKRKSSIIEQNKEDNIKINKSHNKSARKSFMMQESELNTTNNENKSTLVISQLKDDSAVEVNVKSAICKASKDINESNDYQTKSVDVSNNNNKFNEKKNVSPTYSTSTPLQQKSLKRLGTINTSIITPNSVSKVGKKDTLVSNQHESSDSDSDTGDSDEQSKDKNKIFDDEAEEASDDYESGDSRDSDEREYEEQNEILERGETLDSEDEDLSENSDYEKGSFIVSSDDEDDELLSGSGDDLSMSADELMMTAKSKKKYNERKLKEQKKASKEMFEARHQSKSFAETKNRKKGSRQRLDSSDSDVDENVPPPKKNRRQRIDSSHDTSAVKSDAELSVSKEKKKTKRLSDSLCEDSVINEKEITVNKDITIENTDPLDMKNVVKQEPKTPQKDLNISTVAITNIEEVEQVNIDENKSVINSDQTKDPLQNTVVQEDDSEQEDDDSISENEEITQNYESVLSNLNSVKVKSQDISLNLNKKVKEKPKEPIVDELNLTEVKKSKKKRLTSASSSEHKNLNKSENYKSTEKANKSARIHDEDSSDSIDMKLLFPEDSNDSVTCSTKNNENQDTFIPLKRTEAKTNILENTDNAAKSGTTDESVLNVSKEKNKRKSSVTQETTIMDTQTDENISFFIDTTGTHGDVEPTDVNDSVKKSSKKKKASNNVSLLNNFGKDDDNMDDAPIEVSYRNQNMKDSFNQNTTEVNNVTDTQNESAKKKNKKKHKSSNKSDSEITSQNVDVQDIQLTLNKSLKQDKNAQKISENTAESDNLQCAIIKSAKKKNKKARKNLAKNLAAEHLESTVTEVQQDDQPLNNDGVKKNINLKTSKNAAPAESSTDEKPSKKRKRKSSANKTTDEIVLKDTNQPGEALNHNKKIIKIAHDKDVKGQDSLKHNQVYDKSKGKKSKKKVVEIQQGPGLHNETKKNNKRKERDDDDDDQITKISKQNSFDKVHVPRLPAAILNQLDDKELNDAAISKKAKVISTSRFKVETIKRRNNKPSNYLEESVYLNDNMEELKQKGFIKHRKVLPFTPTASTSVYGFTTNFEVKVIPQQTQFIAQSSGVNNFKKEFLEKERIKKLGTFEKYKRHRSIKISKF